MHKKDIIRTVGKKASCKCRTNDKKTPAGQTKLSSHKVVIGESRKQNSRNIARCKKHFSGLEDFYDAFLTSKTISRNTTIIAAVKNA